MMLPTSATTAVQHGLEVRTATAPDIPNIVETLADAFYDDPVMTWWIPEPQRRSPILRAFFQIVVDVNHPHNGLDVTDPDPVAAAVWVPPGCQPAGEDAEQLVGWLIAAAEETAGRLLAALEVMEECHPHTPHSYLFFLGTRRAWQSRGLGSALLADALERCDRGGTPAYLEATSPASRRLYLRHGFEVTGEISLPDGPPLWPMWRDPRRGAD